MIYKKVYYEEKIKDNPIELLNSINILIHKPERLNYPFAPITESFKRVVGMKQKDNNIVDYSKLLKQVKEILEARVVKVILGH